MRMRRRRREIPAAARQHPDRQRVRSVLPSVKLASVAEVAVAAALVVPIQSPLPPPARAPPSAAMVRLQFHPSAPAPLPPPAQAEGGPAEGPQRLAAATAALWGAPASP